MLRLFWHKMLSFIKYYNEILIFRKMFGQNLVCRNITNFGIRLLKVKNHLKKGIFVWLIATWSAEGHEYIIAEGKKFNTAKGYEFSYPIAEFRQ
jgi:hypothetical protein